MVKNGDDSVTAELHQPAIAPGLRPGEMPGRMSAERIDRTDCAASVTVIG